MKTPLLLAFCLAGISIHSFAQTAVNLELINPLTNTSTFVITPGSSFSLNFEIVGPVTTPKLDSFDLSLSGSTSSTTAFATGITLIGYTNLVSGFSGAQSTSQSHPTAFSANANTTGNDLAFSLVPETILTANFTTSSTLAAGTYAIDFPPVGAFQELFDVNGNRIAYNPIDASIQVVAAPEPKALALLLAALAAILGFRFFKRVQV